MKKITLVFAFALSLLATSCTTPVGVDSSANPIATYDHLTGDFYGDLHGTPASVFKAADVALRKNLGYFGTGQNTKAPSKHVIRVRTQLDKLVYVYMTQKEDSMVEVRVSLEGGNLAEAQAIFNEIAKEARKQSGR